MGTLISWYKTACDSIRYDGIAILLWRILAKLLSPVASVYTQMLFEFDLTQSIEPRAARIKCTVGLATEAELEALVDQQLDRPMPDDAELSDEDEYHRAWLQHERARMRNEYREWFRAGELCFVARVGDEIAHNNWLHVYGCAHLSSRPIDIGPGEVYAAEGYTSVRWRGQRLHEEVNAYMLRYAKDRGYRLAYTITDIIKAGARRGILRVGWRKRGQHVTITPRRLGRTWLVRISGDVAPIARDFQGISLRS
jgi:hypothetical protein